MSYYLFRTYTAGCITIVPIVFNKLAQNYSYYICTSKFLLFLKIIGIFLLYGCYCDYHPNAKTTFVIATTITTSSLYNIHAPCTSVAIYNYLSPILFMLLLCVNNNHNNNIILGITIFIIIQYSVGTWQYDHASSVACTMYSKYTMNDYCVYYKFFLYFTFFFILQKVLDNRITRICN